MPPISTDIDKALSGKDYLLNDKVKIMFKDLLYDQVKKPFKKMISSFFIMA